MDYDRLNYFSSRSGDGRRLALRAPAAAWQKAMGEALSAVPPGCPDRESEGPPHRVPGRFFHCTENPVTNNSGTDYRQLVQESQIQDPAYSPSYSPIAVKRFESEFSCTATPSLKATVFPEMAGTRSPGTRMPTRFRGSAADSTIVSPEFGNLRVARNDSTATGRANCSPRKPSTKRPPRISPRSSRRRKAICNSRHFGRLVSRASKSRKTMP